MASWSYWRTKAATSQLGFLLDHKVLLRSVGQTDSGAECLASGHVAMVGLAPTQPTAGPQ